jgi:hypothetical protein
VTTPRPPWELWAPPLAPPADGGLPYADAEAIAAAWWDDDPHLCAALQWEAYAATLPPALAVAQVSTGAQSVSYGRATPGGDLGAAMSRAAWHRSMADTSGSVPCEVVPPPGRPRPVGLAWEVASLDADAGY